MVKVRSDCPGRSFMGVIVRRIVVQGEIFRGSCLEGKTLEGNCSGETLMEVTVRRPVIQGEVNHLKTCLVKRVMMYLFAFCFL